MRELLREYRQTLKETRVLLAKVEKKIEVADGIRVDELQEDKKIINSWISNLQYSIEWLSTGKRPGATRGIENRAAYDREVPFEPYWIQRKIDEKSPDALTSFENEQENMDEDKVQIVKQILTPLNKKEKEILSFSSNGYTQREIGKMLGIPHTTVANVLTRCKRKIDAEGWFML